MGGACRKYGGGERYMQCFSEEHWREETRLSLEDNIEMDLQEMGWGDMDWIGLAQDRERWRVLMNTVMNLRVP